MKKEIRFCPHCKSENLSVRTSYDGVHWMCNNCKFEARELPVKSTKKLTKKELEVLK